MQKILKVSISIGFMLLMAFSLSLEAKKRKNERDFIAVAAPAPVKTINQQEQRVALVIGNSKYTHAPLKNPSNDARDVANKLRDLGFDVVERNNIGMRQIGSTLSEFRSKLRPGAVALVFYAGHGIQIKGENYFPTVDAEITVEEDVPNQSISIRQIMDLLDESKSRLNLVFLDACRNNPYARSFRSAEGGLARISAPSGTLISYATRPGSTAADGDGRNGLYTSKLLQQMESTQPVELSLKAIVREVKATSAGKQEPWMEGSIEGDFCFAGCATAMLQPQQVIAIPEPIKPPATTSTVNVPVKPTATSTADTLARLKNMQAEVESILNKGADSKPYVEKSCSTQLVFLQQAAQQGQAIAQNLLGDCYSEGWGVGKDEAQAVAWYRKAAEQGDALGQLGLVVMYQNGRGVTKDEAQAVAWLRKAAEQGYAPGQNKLGFFYRYGMVVTKDEVQAVAWYRKAAEQGHPQGQYNLGVMYEGGTGGVTKDEAQAVAWYRKAAAQGHEPAIEQLRRLGY